MPIQVAPGASFVEEFGDTGTLGDSGCARNRPSDQLSAALQNWSIPAPEK
ncbi:hypothetical protein [Nocardioides terrisoli]|nr:hypothetical protein [Nocardioides marmorisolisilvae]